MYLIKVANTNEKELPQNEGEVTKERKESKRPRKDDDDGKSRYVFKNKGRKIMKGEVQQKWLNPPGQRLSFLF